MNRENNEPSVRTIKLPDIEQRSIDFIPLHERHGKVWHQAPFWFTGNFVLTTMVVGFTGPTLGLGALQAMVAIFLGVCIGTFFMAFHANQGPRMGLPQMIQSRAQFGLRGAILPFVAVIFVYIGFNVFNLILATDAIATLVPGQRVSCYALLLALAALLAIAGHDVLHAIQRWLTHAMIILFGGLTVGALFNLHMNAALGSTAPFTWSAFLIQLSAAAGYQISYAVYVSDYSRYLPQETPARLVIFWTYLGAAASALWLMALGAWLASALPRPDAIGSLREVGNALLPGLGGFTVVLAVPSLVTVMAVNSYGAMLTSLSAADALGRITPTPALRAAGIGVIALMVFGVALAIPPAYLGSFNAFVLLMLYFLVPWTAVNLVDFYLVRKGHYDIGELFNPNGIYGQWGRPGLAAYVIGLVAMIPFVSLSFYTGPVAAALGGADMAFVVGLLVAGVAYAVMARSQGQQTERQANTNQESMPGKEPI
jgi:NCS1 nucleoside transporter family